MCSGKVGLCDSETAAGILAQYFEKGKKKKKLLCWFTSLCPENES